MGTRRILAAALVLGAVACGSSERAPIEPSATQDEAGIEVALGESFTLKVGQTAAVEGTDLTIRFVAVPEDSRCPTDVQCVWAGDARVELRAGGATTSVHTNEEPRAVPLGEYRIELTALAPEPKSTAKIEQASYVATLVVTRS